MRNLFLCITTVAFSLISCYPNEDEWTKHELVSVTPPISYAGNWRGTYSGGDSGKIYILILANGTASITLFSNYDKTKLTAQGKVSPDGVLTISTTNEVFAISSGKMTKSKMSGTWINPTDISIMGTWTGNKH